MKRRRTIAIVAGVVAPVLIALLVLLATRGTSQATVINSPLLGKPAPTTAGVTLKGSEIDLASYRGRPVVLNFFASWCGPCKPAREALSTFFKQSASTKFVAVVVDFSRRTGVRPTVS